MRKRLLTLVSTILFLPGTPAAASGWEPVEEPSETGRELVVMSYNIMVGRFHQITGEYSDFEENLQAIGHVIRESGADIVLLQEVDVGAERSGRVDQAELLGNLLEMHYEFAPAIDFQGGKYGVGLLSRWPIHDHRVIPLFNPDYPSTHPEWGLDSPGLREQRVLQTAWVEVDGGSLSLLNTHLGLSQHQRRIQLSQIGAVLEEHLLLPGRAVVFGGDLNCEPDALELGPVRKRLRDAYHQIPDERGIPRDVPIRDRLTIRSDQPRACIDYIFVSDHFEVTGTEVLDTTASDHRPVVTRLRVR